MKNVLIIAPHLDDELIGCWSVLNNPDNNVSVVWLYELTETRMREGMRLIGSRLKCSLDKLHFGEYNRFEHIERGDFQEVYVPSRKDSHWDHKKANSLFRQHATHFYSVDMVNGKYLGEYESSVKKDTLNYVYPSQKLLWETNAKYYLFESIGTCDYDVYKTFKCRDYVITVPEEYYAECAEVVMLNRAGNTSREIMSVLLQKCPTGKVTVEYQNQTLVAEG